MKQILVMMFAWTVGVGFSATASSVETVTNDVLGVIASNTTGAEGGGEQGGGNGGGGYKPDKKPDGEGGTGGETPPDAPGGGGGGSETNVLFGVLTVDGVATNLTGGTLTSTTANENVILAKNSASVTVSDYTLTKSGDTSSEDDSNFYAVNAVVAAKTNAMVYISSSTLNSNANGANCLFASGEGSTIYAYDCKITSTKGSSRGLDATYEGTVIAANLDIDTTGEHCAAFATDRGNGSVSVTNASMTTRGQGSPLIYSTGVIEANSVTGTSWGAQIAGIEGLSAIRIKNSVLSGSAEKASEPVANGVIIYQSNSGDYTEGTATFEVSDSTLNSAITNSGAMFYATHTEAVITIQNTELNFDTSQNYLLKAAGNDGKNGWGNAGTNGAGVVFTAIDQTLTGNVTVDGISSLDMYLVNSKYTGAFENDNTYTGDGDGIELFINSNSTWTVTESCTLKSLTAADGATIRDAGGNKVTIADSTGTRVSGTSALKITVSNYTVGDFVATNITDFTISRIAFDAWSGASGGGESEGGDSGSGSGSGSGGSSGKGEGESEGTKTYYFKPHAPTNGVVGVSYNGKKIYPDMDHKYWLDDYWTNGVTVAVDFSANAGYLFIDGSSETNLVLTITENKIEVYPPAGFETAYLAQAKSGATYYLTLEDAIAAVSDRSKIDLAPAAQSNEQAAVDAAVTNEAVVASLVSTNETATVSLSNTTPGLYYWIQGGTDVGAVTQAGPAELSTTGGSVELSKPSLGAAKDRAFFKIAAGVAAPVNPK